MVRNVGKVDAMGGTPSSRSTAARLLWTQERTCAAEDPDAPFHVSPIESRRVGGRSCSLLRVGDTRYLLNTNTLSGLLRATMAGEERGAFLLGKLCDRGREDGQPVDLHALRHVLPDLIPADRWTTARVTLLHVSRNRRPRRFHLMRTIMF